MVEFLSNIFTSIIGFIIIICLFYPFLGVAYIGFISILKAFGIMEDK